MTMSYPAEGRNYLIDVAVNGAPQITDFYAVLYEGDYTFQDEDTAANIVARATEITAYAENTRPSVLLAAAEGGGTSNEGQLVQFTLSATKTVRGFAIVSSAGKGATTGKLLCVQRLPSPRTYAAGDVVKVPISLTISNPI